MTAMWGRLCVIPEDESRRVGCRRGVGGGLFFCLTFIFLLLLLFAARPACQICNLEFAYCGPDCVAPLTLKLNQVHP